jgi:hypothetical protein
MRRLLFGAIACILLTSLAAGPSSAAAPAKKGASAKKSVAKAPALQGGPRVSGIELIRDGKPYVARAVVSDNPGPRRRDRQGFLGDRQGGGGPGGGDPAFTCSETGLLGLRDASTTRPGGSWTTFWRPPLRGGGLLLTLTNLPTSGSSPLG